ncbi:MAG: ComEC/Rec2 family competence protein, partial [Bacteroidales bacterium]
MRRRKNEGLFPPAAAVICGTMAGLYLWGFTARAGVLCVAGESGDGMARGAVDSVAACTGIQEFIADLIPEILPIAFCVTLLVIAFFLAGFFLLRRSAPPRRVFFYGKTNNFVSVSYLRYRYGKHLYFLGLLALFFMGFWHGLVRQMPAGELSRAFADPQRDSLEVVTERNVVPAVDLSHSERVKLDYDLLFAVDRSVIPAGEQAFLCLRVRDFPVHVTTGTGRQYMRMECRLILYSPDGKEQIQGNENIQAYVQIDTTGCNRMPAGGYMMPAGGSVSKASNQWLPGDILITRCRTFPFSAYQLASATDSTTAASAKGNSDSTTAASATDSTTAASATDSSNPAGVPDSANTNTTTFDYPKYMARRGFFRRAYIYDYQYVSGKPTVFEILKRLRIPITRSWEGEAGALLSGICLGDKTGLTAEMRDSFNAAGVGHILAVSGLHVGILYGSLVLLMGLPLRICESRRYKRKRKRKRKRKLIRKL